MAADRAADLLALARELEQRDADVAARIDAVAGVLWRVDEIRSHGSRIRAALEEIPDDIEHAEQAERDARAREAEARAELAEAEQRLDEVSRSRRAGADARADGERAVRRATVGAADAATAVTRRHDRVLALGRNAVALRAEADGLSVEARQAARAVAEVPRLSDSGRILPGGSLDEIEEWGARAHASLFVVRGGLEGERERLVQEANALAAAVLGEQVGGASVALVRRRLEESLSGR